VDFILAVYEQKNLLSALLLPSGLLNPSRRWKRFSLLYNTPLWT